jgi:O-antigen ligase/polysaccharide polymerase Wzy-like membrane protein
MGKFFFIGCAIIIFFGILKSAGAWRLMWFFTGILFFQHRIPLFTSPTDMGFHRFMVYSLLIPELTDFKKSISDFRKFPLFYPLVFVFIGFLLIGFFDTRISFFLQIYRPVDLYIQTFLVIFLAYKNLKEEEDWLILIKYFAVCSIILCLYGFYNFITKTNPYDNLISTSFNSFSSFDFYKNIFDERFRINSFVDHPIYYGYLLGILFLLSFNAILHEHGRFRIIYLSSIVMTFLNLLMTNSRTPLISFLLGIAFFILMSLHIKFKMQIALFTILLSCSVYTIPYVRDKINNTVDIFEKGGSQISGSSLKMREMQLQASFLLFKKKPISGNGLYYIEENLGYSSNEDKSMSSNDLQGFESYFYIIIIEQGIIGIILNAIFFGSLILYFCKRKIISVEYSGLGLAITIMFLTFSIGTGTLGSWIITMAILGIIIKKLQLMSEHPIEMVAV